MMTEKHNQAAAPGHTASGYQLTQSQHDESMMIAGIIAREIKHSGRFKDKLADYSNAFARNQKFDVMRAETIIRDQFKSLHGQSMNETRTALMDREAKLDANDRVRAVCSAREMGTLIRSGETMPFFRAYDEQAAQLAKSLEITEAGAKTLMKDAFQEQHGENLYQWAKAIEKEHHLPRREAAATEREAMRSQNRDAPRPRA